MLILRTHAVSLTGQSVDPTVFHPPKQSSEENERMLCFAGSSTVRWRTTDGRKQGTACLGVHRNPHRDRESERETRENTDSVPILCSLATRPRTGCPTTGGWRGSVGSGVGAGWEEQSGSSTRSDMESDAQSVVDDHYRDHYCCTIHVTRSTGKRFSAQLAIGREGRCARPQSLSFSHTRPSMIRS